MKERCVKERGGSGGGEGEWWLAGMPRLMMRSRERSLICLPFYFTATHDVAEFGFFPRFTSLQLTTSRNLALFPVLLHCNSRRRGIWFFSTVTSLQLTVPRRLELQ